jgi:AcrR family transcriptional regulator
MSPRHYQLGKRQAVIDESRRRVLDAARALLAEPTGYPAFTVDAVARRADVARATVYYQFHSKAGLLEALCDDLAEEGRMRDLPQAFEEPDPHAAVRRLIVVFAGFWAADRVVMRRLRALAALDPDVHAVITARDERRRQGLEVLVGRLGPPGDTQPADAVRALLALTSFESFDTMAGQDRDPGDVVPLVTGLADVVLTNLAGPGSGGG